MRSTKLIAGSSVRAGSRSGAPRAIAQGAPWKHKSLGYLVDLVDSSWTMASSRSAPSSPGRRVGDRYGESGPRLSGWVLLVMVLALVVLTSIARA